MILVEDAPCPVEIEVVGGEHVPWKREDPLEIRADDAVLGRRRRQLGEPLELPASLAIDLLWQAGLVDPTSELRELGLISVCLAELLLDRLQLLSQHVLALRLLHLGLNLRLDLRAQLEGLELAVQDHGERPEP